MAAWLEMGKLLGTPTHIAQQEGAKYLLATYGVNVRPLLAAAPGQDNIAEEQRMLEPTAIGLELGLGKNQGAKVNKAIEALGWQVKKIGGGWEPTPGGKPHCAIHAWIADHGASSGYNLKWNIVALKKALEG
jgi:hypothetical protein